eukprot:TRINITY_DN605_c0_g1_i3.p1 TRINITY_DN605_c0_g1~~TRINITY_DN605_c0_g1_i3.p1  ORF type:complete len:390 (-),score=95.17 TRINITY_DN605_c0_g1_i3:137-1306(-)
MHGIFFSRAPFSLCRYTFVGNGNEARLSTCGPQTDFDTKIFVYRAADFEHTDTCDEDSLVCMELNDDSPCTIGSDDDDLQSTVNICTQQDMRYYVAVAGYSRYSRGYFSLSLADLGPDTHRCDSCRCKSDFECGPDTCGGYCPDAAVCDSSSVCIDNECLPQPINFLCASATRIKGPTTLSGDTRQLSVNAVLPGSTTSCAGLRGPGLWYVVIGTGEKMTFTTCSPSTTFDTEIHVYTSGQETCEHGMQCVTYNDDDPVCSYSSTVSFCSVEGYVYYVLVAGYSDWDKGKFELTYSEQPGMCSSLRRQAVQEVTHKHLLMPSGDEPLTLHPPMLSLAQRKAATVDEKEAKRIAKKLAKAHIKKKTTKATEKLAEKVTSKKRTPNKAGVV